MRSIFTFLILTYGLNGWAQTYFTEEFESPFTFSTWSNIDNDADPSGNYDTWRNIDFGAFITDFGQGSACSISRVNGIDYNPDNTLISPAINLSSASASGLSLLFDMGTSVDAPNSNENYSVYILNSNTLNDVLTATPVLSETLPDGAQIYSKYVDLTPYAGQTIYLAFRHHNCSGEGVFILDNIAVMNLPLLEIAVESVDLPRFTEAGSSNTVYTNVTNEGATEITSVTINWNDGTDHVAIIPTLIPPGATVAVAHPDLLVENSIVEKNILVAVTQINGGLDGNGANNYGSAKLNTISQTPVRNVVLEEGTGTWCSWCPAGEVVMSELLALYPNDLVGIAAHYNDPMEVPGYGINFTAFPQFHVDRQFNDVLALTQIVEQYYLIRKEKTAPANLGGTYLLNGNNLIIDATATFYTNFSNANYRLGVVLVEDSVTGSSPEYDQANGYSGGGNGMMGGYEALPNPVPASQMVYSHVARILLGGYDGQIGSVPATIVDGQVANYMFSYSVPTDVDLNHIKGYVLLIDQNTGEVVNAGPLQNTLSIGEELPSIELSVYPNPTIDEVNIRFKGDQDQYIINLFDAQGRVVETLTVEDAIGNQEFTFDISTLAAGSYLISVSDRNTSYNQVLLKR